MRMGSCNVQAFFEIGKALKINLPFLVVLASQQYYCETSDRHTQIRKMDVDQRGPFVAFVDLKTASLFCSWKVAVIVPVAAFCLRQAVQLFGMPRNKCSKGGVVHCLVSVYNAYIFQPDI